MLLSEPAEFVLSFISNIDEEITKLKPNAKLTKTQKAWLAFCLTGIIVVNAMNWSKFERASLGEYQVSSLSWMLRHSKIFWDHLFTASVCLILRQYGILEGSIAIDESDIARSKKTKRTYKTHKQKHKASGGYVNGQTVVLIILVTDSITVPIGFDFYMPDPALTKWSKEEKRLKKLKVIKKERPIKPERNILYPTKIQISLDLLNKFKENHKDIKINAILADALYGESNFMSQASKIFDNTQVISQLRENQNIEYKGKKRSLKDYFNKINKGVQQVMRVRGGKKVVVTASSARLKVTAHGKKRFVIALKYEGEDNYRFLVATDMTWRTMDIIQAYSLRWLVEVFFEDWKLYEGWGQEAKQLDEEGSSRGLILSLLLDHCLLLHPEQMACIENKLPAYTVGSLQRKSQIDILLKFVDRLLQNENPSEKLKELSEVVKDVFKLMPSSKHMVGRDLGTLQPTDSLRYRNYG